MSSEVILNNMKYLRIHNVSIHITFYQNRLKMNVLGRIFLNSRKERRKDEVFL